MTSIVCGEQTVLVAGSVDTVTKTLVANCGPLLMTSIFHANPAASAVSGARIVGLTSTPVWATAAVAKRERRTRERRRDRRVIWLFHFDCAAELRGRRAGVEERTVRHRRFRPEEAVILVARHGCRHPLSAPIAERGEAEGPLPRVETD